jgi:membrane-associated phospholipid phosphatase
LAMALPKPGGAAPLCPEIRAAVATIAAAIALDARSCIDLLYDEVAEGANPGTVNRAVALSALVQRMGWMADEVAFAAKSRKGPAFDDAPGWFGSGHAADALRALRTVDDGGSQ